MEERYILRQLTHALEHLEVVEKSIHDGDGNGGMGSLMLVKGILLNAIEHEKSTRRANDT